MTEQSVDPRDFLEFLVCSLVGNPDAVEIAEIDKDKRTVYELVVHADDLPGLFAEGGRVAAAIRTALDACSYMQRRRTELVFIDEPSADELDHGEEEANN